MNLTTFGSVFQATRDLIMADDEASLLKPPPRQHPYPMMAPEVLMAIDGNLTGADALECRTSASGRYFRESGDDVGWRFDVPGVLVVECWTPLSAVVVAVTSMIESNP